MRLIAILIFFSLAIVKAKAFFGSLAALPTSEKGLKLPYSFIFLLPT